MSRPTEEEALLLKEFRARVGDVLKTVEHESDAYLLRWLRARNLNLERAEAMLRTSMEWRAENNVDNVMTRTFDPFITTNYPFWVEGKDFHGQPVVVVPFGSWDMRKVTNERLEEELMSYLSFSFESILTAIRNVNSERPENEYPITQVTIILDWKNFSYGQLMNWKALQKILKMGATYEAHYPEILYTAFMFNCPSFFPMFMKMLKPILAPKTYDKITCYSANKSEWEPILHKLVPKDQLHSSLTCTTGGK